MTPTQMGELRALLAQAQLTTVYYASRLPLIDESSSPAEILRKLKPISKSELRQEKVRLTSAVGNSGSWRFSRTSGTTGEPIEVIFDEHSLTIEADVLGACFDRWLSSRDWRSQNLMHLVLHAHANSQATRSPWNPNSLVIKWNLLRTWGAGEQQLLESLRYLDDQIVTALPSVALVLSRRLANAKSPIRPRMIVLSGETVEKETVTEVEQAFNCPVNSLYVTGEAGTIGVACERAGDYHVAEQKVFLEILDDSGQAVDPPSEGEAVITAIANYAMPLIRYRTNDRAVWLSGPCNCGETSPRFHLNSARRPVHLTTGGGGSVNTIRFAKLFGGFNLDRYGIFQTEDLDVVIPYISSQPLEPAVTSVMMSSVRAALGPEVNVNIYRASSSEEFEVTQRALKSVNHRARRAATAAPDGASMDELVAWLRLRLASIPGLGAAVITGSAINPSTTTRFSDIDLVLLFSEHMADPSAQISLARELRGNIPGLSVNFDHLGDLQRRSPLVTCRLLKEQLLITGRLDSDLLEWPSVEDLVREGQLWAQQAGAMLWHQLTTIDNALRDPIQAAWIAAKQGLTALRYRHLASGGRQTASDELIKGAIKERDSLPWLDDLIEITGIAREHQPPPLATADVIRAYIATAWSGVSSTANVLSGLRSS